MKDFTGLGFMVFSLLIGGFFHVKIQYLTFPFLLVYIILFIKLIYLKYLLNLYREKKIKIIDLLFSKHNDFFFFNLLQDPSNIYVVSISFV